MWVFTPVQLVFYLFIFSLNMLSNDLCLCLMEISWFPFVSSWIILKIIIEGDLSFVYSWVLDYVRTICCQI